MLAQRSIHAGGGILITHTLRLQGADSGHRHIRAGLHLPQRLRGNHHPFGPCLFIRHCARDHLRRVKTPLGQGLAHRHVPGQQMLRVEDVILHLLAHKRPVNKPSSARRPSACKRVDCFPPAGRWWQWNPPASFPGGLSPRRAGHTPGTSPPVPPAPPAAPCPASSAARHASSSRKDSMRSPERRSPAAALARSRDACGSSIQESCKLARALFKKPSAVFSSLASRYPWAVPPNAS